MATTKMRGDVDTSTEMDREKQINVETGQKNKIHPEILFLKVSLRSFLHILNFSRVT